MKILHTNHIVRCLFSVMALVALSLPLSTQAQTPGGIIESIATAQARPTLSQSQLQSLLPTRGAFTFPAPYNTRAARITNASDCAGADCVNYVGYSYWRNINNHVNSDTMYIFIGLERTRGGAGPTLFSYNKLNDTLANAGPLFDSSSSYSWASGEGWYFSATMPTKLYMNDGPKMLRYDVLSKQFTTVFDATSHFGPGKVIWQMHSSNDDRVHSATLRDNNSYEMLGCMVYSEATSQFSFYPKTADFDECQIDKSGQWLVIKDNLDGIYGEDNRIINVSTGAERVLLDQNGAGGHSDLGFGTMVAADNWSNQAGAQKVWQFNSSQLQGTTVYNNFDWNVQAPSHVSYTNARSDIALSQQYACGSSANRTNSAHANEIICFRADSSTQALVVAPVMTDLNAAGGGGDDYSKAPKGNLDVTGKYFVWTSNTGGNRLDAFIVKVPGELLTGPATDTVAPTVAITAPTSGQIVSSATTVTATATDNTAIAGVQFRIDGTNIGAEDTSAPYSNTWNPAGATAGTHTLTAVARDTAGNSTTSAPVTVTVPLTGDTSKPLISGVAAQGVTGTTATIVWTTNELSDTQVEYGLTTAYGSSTSLNPTAVTAHSQALSGLNSNSVYHYRVKSKDSAGNLAISGNFNFTTAVVADTVRPIITNVTAQSITATSAAISWTTNEPARSHVEYGLTSAYGESTVLSTTHLTNHTVSLTGLKANTVYYYNPRSRDAAGNLRESKGWTFKTTPSAAQPVNVTWTTPVNAAVTSTSLQKTTGCDGCDDSGAVSQQQLNADGFLEFTASETATMRFVGLTNNYTGTTSSNIAFALRFQSGNVEVRENGVYRSETAANNGDKFRIEVKANKVTYAKNGTVFYTSTAVPVYPLRTDASLFSINASVNNAVMSGG